MTAAEQLRRILLLLPRLADGESHRLDDVLAEASMDMRAFMHDIQLISERYDGPGGFVEGVQIHFNGDLVEMTSSHFRRPMRVTAKELCALELGLAMLRAERPAEDGPAIERARERLHQTISRLPDDGLLDGDGRLALTDDRHNVLLADIRRAMGARTKVHMRYRKGADSASTERTVCPYSLVFASSVWYLVAHCENGDGLRVFRLDRIEQLQLLDESYRIPSGFDVDQLLRDDRLFGAERPRTLVVRYSPRIARWIAEREGCQPDSDGSLTVRHPLADTDWAVRHVLQYGPDAEILEPSDVRDEISRRLRSMLAAGVEYEVERAAVSPLESVVIDDR